MSSLSLLQTTATADGIPQFQIWNNALNRSGQPTELPDPHTWPVPDAGDGCLMEQLRWYLERFLDYPFPPYTERAEKIEAALRGWGEAAFECLFDSRQTGDWVSKTQGELFDFLISLDSPHLLAWPWEALCATDIGYFGHRARIQRRLSENAPTPTPIADDLPTDCIQILLVTARPYENDVDYRSISRPLVDLIRQRQLPVQITVLRPPTFDQLRQHLQDHPGKYHIFHFDGHGGYGQSMPSPTDTMYLRGHSGRLLFENAQGGKDEISAEQLHQLLADCRVPYAVLNACRSGAIDAQAEGDSAFASIAGALVKAGFHGVLAMSHNLTVSGANVFFPTFYQQLIHSGNLLDATRSGRLQMVQQASRSAYNPQVHLADWLLPVVYQQSETVDLSFAADATAPEASIALPEESDIAHVDHFVGRDEAIHQLERRLRKKCPSILIHGLGGTGKSSLARHFLQWLRDTGGLEYPPFWVSFDTVRSASYVLNQVGRAIFGPQFDSDDEQAYSALAHVCRDQLPLLLVWDNFESVRGLSAESVSATLPEDDALKLRDFLHALHGGKTKILITSRSDETWLPETDCHRLQLGGLRGNDLWDYIGGLADELDIALDRKDPDARQLFQITLDGHPILVRTVLGELRGRTLATVNDQIADILSNYTENADSDIALDPAWARMMGALTLFESGLTEVEQTYLDAIALHRRYVDLDYVQAMGEQSGEVTDYDHGVAHSVFARACSCGLLSLLGDGIYTIHPMFTSFLQTREIAEQWQRGFVSFMGIFADSLAPKPLHEQRVPFFLHKANFHHALDIANQHEITDFSAALVQALAAWAQNNRDWSEASRLFLVCAKEKQAAMDFSGEASTYHQLGIIAEEQRDFEAAKNWYLKSLAIKEKQGNEHGAASTYHQLGTVTQEQRDFEAAENWYLKSLAISEKQGNEHHAAITYHQLGSIAGEQRDFEAAENWYLKSLAISEKQGNEHYAAGTYHQLGRIAQVQRDFEAAENWYLKSLVIKEKQGDEHGAAITYHQLGTVTQEQRDFEAAENWYLKSLAIKEKQGNEHGAAITYHQLGIIAQEQRDFEAAENWYLKSLAIKEKQSNEHGAASTYHQLGILAKLQKQWLESCDQFLSALDRFERSNDQRHAIQVLVNIVQLLEQAPPDAQKACEAKLKNHGGDEILATLTSIREQLNEAETQSS